MKRIVLILLFFYAGALVAQRPGPPPSADPWAYGNGPRNWDPSWNNRPPPRRGACFFIDSNFRGKRFCVRSGDRFDRLPGGYGNSISAIQTFGGAHVVVYDQDGFRGGQQVFQGTVPDLTKVRYRGGQSWNDRISSIVVR